MNIQKAVDFIETGFLEKESDTAVSEYLIKCSRAGEDFIKSKISEQSFVKFLAFVKALTIISAQKSGVGSSLLDSDRLGELTGYTHALIITVLGALVEDEAL